MERKKGEEGRERRNMCARVNGVEKEHTNNCRYGLNFSSQLLLYLVQIESVVVRDEVDGESKVSVSSRSPNSMQVSFRILREVEIDNHVHCLYIYPPSK
jgi:hypothetical protein